MANFPWPGGKRVAVALSFDMDGECMTFIFDRRNGANRLSLQSETSYGPEVGMPRILDLLERHALPASFFVPGFTAELHPNVVREMVARGHEVGHHGYFHERPDFQSDAAEEQILIKGIEVLEAITGKRPFGYRSPAWELKPTSPALLKKYGFVYDSSLMGDDEPYLIPAGSDGETLIELPVQWMNDDFPHFAFSALPAIGTGISSTQKVFEVWSEEFLGYREFGGCYVLTMHPFIIGRPSRIRLLERMVTFMEGFDDVWFASLGEIADHARASGAMVVRPPKDLAVTWRPTEA